MFLTTRGLVLREVRYKESDKILTVLTQHEGKVTVRARGALRKGSRITAATQLLTYSDMTIFENRGRRTLNEASTVEEFLGLRADLVQIQIRHDGGLAGIGEDELLLLKDLEHLAHRRTADMKIVGQLRIGDLFTRLHLHEDDPVVQSLEDLRLCAGHLGRVGRIRQRHGRTSR